MNQNELEYRKMLVRTYAKNLGLTNYNVSFTEKNYKKETFSKNDLLILERLSKKVQKINNALGFDITDNVKKREYVLMRNAFLFIHKDKRISQFVFSKLFNIDRSTISFHQNSAIDFYNNQDSLFIDAVNKLNDILKVKKITEILEPINQ